jgi:hypothetical protein
MIWPNNITFGIIIRWGLIQLAAISLVVLMKPGFWGALFVAIALNALGTYLIVDYIQKYKGVKLKLDEHPIDPTQRHPARPLPSALNTASLAAKRAARQAYRSRLPSQKAISSSV